MTDVKQIKIQMKNGTMDEKVYICKTLKVFVKVQYEVVRRATPMHLTSTHYIGEPALLYLLCIFAIVYISFVKCMTESAVSRRYTAPWITHRAPTAKPTWKSKSFGLKIGSTHTKS